VAGNRPPGYLGSPGAPVAGAIGYAGNRPPGAAAGVAAGNPYPVGVKPYWAGLPGNPPGFYPGGVIIGPPVGVATPGNAAPGI
jgi:hypothetical protein